LLTRQLLQTKGDNDIVNRGFGFDYDPINDKFVAWRGGADVYTLDPVTLVWSKISPSASNTVIPTAANLNGTFGRFRYIPSKNAFIVVNAVNQNVYIYKLNTASGGSVPPVTPPVVVPPKATIVRTGVEYTKISDAAAAAQDGDTINIGAGTFTGANAATQWTKNNLTINGVAGATHIDCNSVTESSGKGCWLFRGHDYTVNDIDIYNAHGCCSDNIGAFCLDTTVDGTNVFTRVHLHHSDQGMNKGGTPTSIIKLINSEVDHNGSGSGQTHNIYISEIGEFWFINSYSHHTLVGHNLKTRAKKTYILYSRISDEDGNASQQLDFPQGGEIYVIGNIIQKGYGNSPSAGGPVPGYNSRYFSKFGAETKIYSPSDGGSLNVTSGGSGYVDASPPTVTISGGGSTVVSNATAKATGVGGMVTRVTLINPGVGYTTTPTVTIAPPVSGVTATAQTYISAITGTGVYTWPVQKFYVVNNTWINPNTSANDSQATAITFNALYSTPSAGAWVNNLVVGVGVLLAQSGGQGQAANLTQSGNLQIPLLANSGLVNPSPGTWNNALDAHLLSNATAINAGSDPGFANGFNLTPQFQYVHPAGAQTRTTVNTIDIGAYEFGNVGQPLPILGGP
jgi:hypothetical protein